MAARRRVLAQNSLNATPKCAAPWRLKMADKVQRTVYFIVFRHSLHYFTIFLLAGMIKPNVV